MYKFTATEIQNIQIADGDVCRGVSIPIYMVFPRLFTCPTLSTNNFKVGECRNFYNNRIYCKHFFPSEVAVPIYINNVLKWTNLP